MSAELQAVLPPCPQTKRGHGIQMHATAKGDKFVYCNGKHVIIRHFENPSQCEIFSEHKCNVSVAKFSPNGEWCASGDSRGRVFVWAVNNQHIKAEVNVCRNVLDIAWSPDGKRIIGVGDGNDSFARAFMWDSGNTVGDIANHSKQILSCDHKPTRPFRVVTCSEDKQVNFYTGPPFRFDKMFDGHSRFPNRVRFSPDGAYFISVACDKRIVLFDGKTGDYVRDLTNDNGHSGSIWSFCWSPDSKEILTVSGDSTAKIWNVETSNVEVTFTFPSEQTNSYQQVGALWHKDYLVTVSLSGTINFLDRSQPSQPKQTLIGHQVALNAMDVDLQTKTIITASAAGTILRWNPHTNELHSFCDVGDGGVNVSAISVVPGSSQVVSAGFDDIVRFSNGNTLATSGTNTDGQPVGLSSSGDLVALVTRKKSLTVYRNGSKLVETSLSFMPTDVAFAPDASEIAVSGDKSLHIFAFNGDSLTVKSKLDKHTDTTYCVAYSPNGKFIASGDGQRYLYIWNRDSGEVCNKTGWRFHNARVTGVAFSPDSTRLASTSIDQNVLIWQNLDSFTSDRIRIEPAHIGGVSSVAFLDQHEVVSIGDDRAVKLWKLD